MSFTIRAEDTTRFWIQAKTVISTIAAGYTTIKFACELDRFTCCIAPHRSLIRPNCDSISLWSSSILFGSLAVLSIWGSYKTSKQMMSTFSPAEVTARLLGALALVGVTGKIFNYYVPIGQNCFDKTFEMPLFTIPLTGLFHTCLAHGAVNVLKVVKHVFNC